MNRCYRGQNIISEPLSKTHTLRLFQISFASIHGLSLHVRIILKYMYRLSPVPEDTTVITTEFIKNHAPEDFLGELSIKPVVGFVMTETAVYQSRSRAIGRVRMHTIAQGWVVESLHHAK